MGDMSASVTYVLHIATHTRVLITIIQELVVITERTRNCLPMCVNQYCCTFYTEM